MFEIIRVEVAGKIREYPGMVAEFGTFLAEGGAVVSLFEASRQAREFFRKNKDRAWVSLNYWATIDESGLAYHVEIGRSGHYAITGASPLPGPNNVRELYVA